MKAPSPQPAPPRPLPSAPKGKPWLVLASSVTATAMAIAIAFTSPNEGTRYTAYPDPATHSAPWTICKGHTRGVRAGDTATPAQCDAYFREDMAIAAAAVGRCIRVPLTVTQAAALYDTVFNTGARVVCGSTLQRVANAGDTDAMCGALSAWKYANKVVYQPLVRRRTTAIELCRWPAGNPNLVYPTNWKPQ